jgi:hypothetical protein
MHAVEIQQHADKLYAALGPKALAEAAQKARHFEERGDAEEAATWRRIEKALVQGHGPRAK